MKITEELLKSCGFTKTSNPFAPLSCLIGGEWLKVWKRKGGRKPVWEAQHGDGEPILLEGMSSLILVVYDIGRQSKARHIRQVLGIHDVVDAKVKAGIDALRNELDPPEY